MYNANPRPVVAESCTVRPPLNERNLAIEECSIRDHAKQTNKDFIATQGDLASTRRRAKATMQDGSFCLSRSSAAAPPFNTKFTSTRTQQTQVHTKPSRATAEDRQVDGSATKSSQTRQQQQQQQRTTKQRPKQTTRPKPPQTNNTLKRRTTESWNDRTTTEPNNHNNQNQPTTTKRRTTGSWNHGTM